LLIEIARRSQHQYAVEPRQTGMVEKRERL